MYNLRIESHNQQYHRVHSPFLQQHALPLTTSSKRAGTMWEHKACVGHSKNKKTVQEHIDTQIRIKKIYIEPQNVDLV